MLSEHTGEAVGLTESGETVGDIVGSAITGEVVGDVVDPKSSVPWSGKWSGPQ